MVGVGLLILFGLQGCSRTGFIEWRLVVRGLRLGRGKNAVNMRHDWHTVQVQVRVLAVAAQDFRVGTPCHAPPNTTMSHAGKSGRRPTKLVTKHYSIQYTKNKRQLATSGSLLVLPAPAQMQAPREPAQSTSRMLSSLRVALAACTWCSATLSISHTARMSSARSRPLARGLQSTISLSLLTMAAALAYRQESRIAEQRKFPDPADR